MDLVTRYGLLEPFRVSDVNGVSPDLMKRGPAVRILGHLTANQDTSKHIEGQGPILVIRATSVLPAHIQLVNNRMNPIAKTVRKDLSRMQTNQTV